MAMTTRARVTVSWGRTVKAKTRAMGTARATSPVEQMNVRVEIVLIVLDVSRRIFARSPSAAARARRVNMAVAMDTTTRDVGIE